LFLGIGRSRPVDEQGAPGVAAVAASVDPAATESNATHALQDEPQFLPPVEPAAHGASDRWSPRGEGDRYATRTVSHDASSERELAAEQPPRSLSRFSSADLPPAADDPAPSEPAAGTEPEPADTPAAPLPAAALMPAADPIPPANAPIVPPAAVAPPTAAAASDILAGNVESTEPSAATEPAPPVADESPDQVPIPSDTPSTDDQALQPPPAASAAAEPEAGFEPAPPVGAEPAAPAPLDTEMAQHPADERCSDQRTAGVHQGVDQRDDRADHQNLCGRG
jgi:hypothetical protein